MSTSNSDTLVRLLTDAVRHGDFAYIDDVVDPDVVLPEMPGAGQGRDGYKEGLRLYGNGVTYHSITAANVVEEGDTVVAHVVVNGKHTGPLMGIEATGIDFEIEQMVIAKFHSGKIVQFWNVADRLSLVSQLQPA
jgi:predicted ester cyclase